MRLASGGRLHSPLRSYPQKTPMERCLRLASQDVIDTLSELFAMRGVMRHIRSDNEPEFVAHALRRSLGAVGVGTH